MTIQRFCPEQFADRLKLALHTGSCWKPVFVGVYSRFSSLNSTAEVTRVDKIRKVCDTWQAYSQRWPKEPLSYGVYRCCMHYLDNDGWEVLPENFSEELKAHRGGTKALMNLLDSQLKAHKEYRVLALGVAALQEDLLETQEEKERLVGMKAAIERMGRCLSLLPASRWGSHFKLHAQVAQLHLQNEEIATQEERLGQGMYGDVYKVIVNTQELARKRLRKENQGEQLTFWKEVAALALLDHPNIIRLHYYNAESLTLYLSCADGMLNTFWQQGATAERPGVLLGIIAALGYLGTQGFLYGDLKMNNLLMKEGQVLLSDFGMAANRSQFENHILNKHYEFDASDHYPPEIRTREINEALKGQLKQSDGHLTCDIWALGGLLWKLFLKKSIAQAPCEVPLKRLQELKSIDRQKIGDTCDFEEGFPWTKASEPLFCTLILECLADEYTRRAKMERVKTLFDQLVLRD